MPEQASGIRAARIRPVGHLGKTHPLAEVAIRHCRAHQCNGPRLGRVACGAAWERAIRDDERVAVEHGLPRNQTADPAFVDDIAVRLALRGEQVDLTDAERAEVERRRAEAAVSALDWAAAA